MDYIDIGTWIKQSDSPSVKELRQAVHIVITAISKNPFLQTKMIMKGGVLLAIRFKSTRYTRDIDFSSSEEYAGFDETKLLDELREGLLIAGESFDYGLDCRIQSYEVDPAREDVTFPTLKIKIGYAYKGTLKHKRLIIGQSPSVLAIDFSFNEYNQGVDLLEIAEGANIRAYTLVDLVGEKYRAIIQQKVRNRVRRQDAYDIYWLLERGYLDNPDLKVQILSSLEAKATSRDLLIDRHTLRDPEIINRSRSDYGSLAQEIEGELPPFDEIYGMVTDYYESLPWKT